jgi:hypothetical protein
MSTALPLEQYRNQQDVDHHVAVDFGTGALNLLLMRMEALQLEPDEVRRIEPDAFSHLAEACAHVASKGSCKQDLASLGTAAHGWEYYCPNVGTLSAMVALPWFEEGRKRHTQ